MNAGDAPSKYCTGFFGKEFTTAYYPELAAKLVELDENNALWTGGPTRPIPRKDEFNGRTAFQTIRALKGASDIPFADVGVEGVVVARLMVAATSPKDKRYKIGHTKDMLDSYFIVVSKINGPPSSGGNDDSQSIASWTIFGVKRLPDKSYTLVPMNSSKAGFRRCDHDHKPGETRGEADFLTCKHARELEEAAMALPALTQFGPIIPALLERLGIAGPAGYTREQVAQVIRGYAGYPVAPIDSVTASKIEKAIDIVFAVITDLDAPAWVRCGPGCCTVDDP